MKLKFGDPECIADMKALAYQRSLLAVVVKTPKYWTEADFERMDEYGDDDGINARGVVEWWMDTGNRMAVKKNIEGAIRAIEEKYK